MRFTFGEWSLDPDRRELTLGGALVPLEPQAFDVLVYLVRNRTRVVPKEELMDTIWGGRFVSETAVTSRIKQIRRALSDDGSAQSMIRTYHGRGYRFVADTRDDATPFTDVNVSHASLAGTVPAPAARVQGSHVEASPVEMAPVETAPVEAAPGRIAGPPPVLVCRRESAQLSFQISGQGPPDLVLLSPSTSLTVGWDDAARADLLHALGSRARLIRIEGPVDSLLSVDVGQQGPTLLDVLDEAASDQTIILAESLPAWPVADFAYAHPDRVSGLVLFGVSVATAGTDPTVLHQWASALPAGLPTLVLHRTKDPVVPVGQARRLAAMLPSAEFRALPGNSHDVDADVGQLVDAIDALVRGRAADEAGRRSLTSLVGLAGDDLEALTAVLVELGGRRRRGPESAVIVSFDGPANAFRALGSPRARGLVDEVGVGVAIDDVSRESYLVSGHGVDVARLFAGLAQPGEVLFPNVIKYLIAGSGLKSEPLPPVDLPHVGPHPVHRWLRT